MPEAAAALEPPPQALISRRLATAGTATTAGASRRTVLDRDSRETGVSDTCDVLLGCGDSAEGKPELAVFFMGYSLRSASMGANLAARLAG